MEYAGNNGTQLGLVNQFGTPFVRFAKLRLPLGSDMCSACFLVKSPSRVHGSVLPGIPVDLKALANPYVLQSGGSLSNMRFVNK